MNDHLPFLRAANKGLSRLPAVSLDPGEIEGFVLRREGMPRIPGDHWREPFRLLCAELERSAALSPLGRVMANGQLVGLLRARCRAERLLARHPEIHDQPVFRPIIILGPMRSGSTRLQRLLACDPRMGWTRLYESLFPVPRGRGGRGRIAAATAVHSTLRALNPAIQRIHPSGPLRPDEEFGFLSYAFESGQFGVQWNVPNFVAAEAKRDMIPVARELRLLLHVNGWARRQRPGPLLLKCPAYSDMVEALVEVFPGARLICLSRDPAKVVASSASLVVEQRRIHSDRVDPIEVGAEWLARTAVRQRRVDAFRKARPGVPAFDLQYDEMTADWTGVMHRLYRFLKLPLDPQALSAMQRYMGKARAHRGHRYALKDYGLDDASVRSAFASSPPPELARSMMAAE